MTIIFLFVCETRIFTLQSNVPIVIECSANFNLNMFGSQAQNYISIRCISVERRFIALTKSNWSMFAKNAEYGRFTRSTRLVSLKDCKSWPAVYCLGARTLFYDHYKHRFVSISLRDQFDFLISRLIEKNSR